MQVSLKKMPIQYKLKYVEEATEVKKLMEQEYERLQPKIEIKGFRKGHVPRHEAEKSLDKFNLYRGIFDKLYLKAVEEQNLQVVDAKDFEVLGQFSENDPLVMQAIVYLRPKVLMFDMSKVNVIAKQTEITDAMVDEQIKVLQDAKGTFNIVDDENYVIKTGDAIVMDYVGKIAGKEFKGGSAKNYRYIVGTTKFIDGFEEQLLHCKKGTNIVNVKFPSNYFTEEYRDKEAEFTVNVNRIDSKEVKSIEDLAAVESQSVEQFKQTVRQKLIDDHKIIDEESFESDVLSACISSCEIEPIPDVMVMHDLDNEWNQLLHRMSMTEEAYLKKNKSAKDMFYAQRRKRIEKTIETRVFLDYICDLHKIEVTREEVETFVKGRADKLQKTGKELDSILENLKKDVNYRASENAIKHEKAATFLVEKMKDFNATTKA